MRLYTPAVRRQPAGVQPIAFESPLYLQPGFRAIEEQRQEAERRAAAVEENFRAVQKRLKEALAQVKELDARLSMNEAQNGTNDGEIAALRDQLRETSERLHKAELDNNALRERMSLRQQELDEARRMISEMRTGGQDALRARLEAADRRAGEMELELGRLASELTTSSSRLQTSTTRAVHELEGGDELEIEQEDDVFEHPVIIRNATNESSPQRVR